MQNLEFVKDDINVGYYIGWRADGTGSPKHMLEIFPPRIAEQKIEFWKTVPISFESYW